MRYEDSRRLLERIAFQANLDASIWGVPASRPGKGIRRVAEQVNADLIVLGSRHGSGPGRVDLNNRTRAVLNGSPCSIAIAPVKYGRESSAVNSIGVGYDGRAESEHALGFAANLAQDLNAKLLAIEVVDATEYSTAARFDFNNYKLEEPLNSAIRDEITAMPGAEGIIKVGFTEVELVEFSSTVDLLVLGSRGYGPLGRLIHGSTSLQVAHNARCPLLLLTRATRQSVPTPAHNRGLSDRAVGAGSTA